MKKLFITIVAMLLPLLASADDVEINGIYYNLVNKTKTAEVTKNPQRYEGTIVIPEKVTYNGESYKVTQLGENCFQYCSIKEVKIPSTVEKIGRGAFQGSGLVSINLPGNVSSIGAAVFFGCRDLITVTLGDGITSIGREAFKNCSGLTVVVIPESVEVIETGAFSGCSNLTTINIPSKIKTIQWYVFGNCTKLTSIIIPDGVTFISRWAFNNSGLTSIIIPNNVEEIELEAFINCNSLKTVSIGSGIKEIGSKVFSNCYELTDVYCYANSVPNTASDAFENSYIEHTTLYVPEGSIDDYKASKPWNGFGTIAGLSTGINSITIDSDDAWVFDMQGNRLDNVRKGVNIIRTKDGKTKKVMVK